MDDIELCQTTAEQSETSMGYIQGGHRTYM